MAQVSPGSKRTRATESTGGAPGTRRRELASFLRSRRERLRPEAVGLPPGRRRRTAGLRREEVAELAGISTDWYVRLEQGRAVSPSSTTVDALAHALRLDEAEHAHLMALTRNPVGARFVPERVPETLKRMVESLHQPAYVTGRRWDVLHWNEAADDLFAFGRTAPADRNVLLSMLTSPAARRLFGRGWAAEARRMVAEFRVAYDLWADDPAFAELLERLRHRNAEFEGWWKQHDVRRVAAGRKTLHHPKKGRLRFEYASFQANDDPGLKLVVYTPA